MTIGSFGYLIAVEISRTDWIQEKTINSTKTIIVKWLTKVKKVNFLNSPNVTLLSTASVKYVDSNTNALIL